MRAAAQCCGIQTGPGQHPLCGHDMIRLTIVRRTSEREFFVSQAITVGSPRFHKDQRLQGFDCRSRVHRPLDIANGKRQAAISINHSNGAAMVAFDHPAAKYFDKNRVLHSSVLHSSS